MFQICDLKKLKNLTTKCTIPTNPNSYWLTIIEKKETENPNPQWPQAALLFTNSASKNNLNFLSAKQKEEKIKKEYSHYLYCQWCI